MSRLHVRVLAGRLDRTAGSHVYHMELAERLTRRGHRVSVVCFGPLEAGETFPYEVVALPGIGAFEWPVLWRFAPLAKYRACTRLIRSAPLEAPDITIGGEHLFLKAHARRFPGRPWLYLPHSLLIEHEIRGSDLNPVTERLMLALYSRLQAWALDHASRTARFTRYGCDVLQDSYGRAPAAAFWVNPIGVDIPGVASPAREPDTCRLLLVGSLNDRKRPEIALLAAAHIESTQWHLDVVGDGPRRSELEALVATLGIADRVTFHGQCADVQAFYRRADLLLLPSRSESLGIVVLEAMACGVPVLAMRADGRRFFNPLAEILREDTDGFLADDDADFGRRLSSLAGALPAVRAAGAEARAAASVRYTWDAHVDRYESLFEEMMQARNARGMHLC